MIDSETTIKTGKIRDYSLEHEFNMESGTIVISGINAIVRLLIEQAKADRNAGLNTAGFVSGYRGSPLGGLDLAMIKKKNLLQKHHIEFNPGVNEDLGVTAVYGSQIVNNLPDPIYDGVFGLWYGKAPGVDRSGDAFKHANFVGVWHKGGVLAIAGDDPASKSSTIPSQSEPLLAHAQMPILYPGSVQEILTLGRYGYELSRFSGLWVAFKVVTDIADAFATVDIKPIKNIELPEFTFEGKPWRHTQQETLLPPYSLSIEKEINHGRLEAAKLFAYANNINKIKYASSGDKIGIVTAGKTYYDVMEALEFLGFDEEKLNSIGVRVLKLGMTFPLDEKIINEFKEGLDELFIIEEKRSFIEMQTKEILFNSTQNLLVVGKTDEGGNELIKTHGELLASTLVDPIRNRLSKYIDKGLFKDLPEKQINIELNMLQPLEAVRTPFYCSGCPHNVSTNVIEGSIGSAGIGCHAMVVLQDRNTKGLIQMGGEGVHWVGASKFSNTKHIFQNLGDGTLFHSGSMAIRQAIASETNITYKILWNGVVAMTGAQLPEGEMPLPELTRSLEAEGVKKIIICGPKVKDYKRGLKWSKNTKIWHRDRFDEAQGILRDIEGTTILIYDQECAANLRRKRKRGQVSTPKHQVFINEAVCEGCGDCGEKSNCLSVFPVQSEFGRKTQIHQSSCNRDYTCLKGDCPAFITVVQKNTAEKAPYIEQMLSELDDLVVPPPELKINGDANIFLTGIGGTGVVTITRILSTAAMLDGKAITSLDQTGLSQKGGPVVAHIKIMNEKRPISNRISDGEADVFLLFDLISGTADKNLMKAKKGKTVAIAAISKIPTGKMIGDINELYPDDQIMISRLEHFTGKGRNVYVDSANLAENLFDSFMYANMITLGAAYQNGSIPISFEALLKAIDLNGVAVKNNQRALKVGRMLTYNPEWVTSFEIKRWGDWELQPEITTEARDLIDSIHGSEELTSLLDIRIPELIDYQNIEYAIKFVEFVKQVVSKESELNQGFPLAETVSRYLFKLMAYKDEYEVSRLYLKQEFNSAIEHQFGKGAEINYMLHPPFLRSIGWKNKIRFGSWFKKFYKVLHKMKFLRGTRFDIFGYAHVRKMERALILEYRGLIEKELQDLDLSSRNYAIQIAELPDIIRGYEEVKERNIKLYYERLEQLQKSSKN